MDREWSTPGERELLARIQDAMAHLPAPCIAAVAKHALGLLDLMRDDYVTLAQLDAITDRDQEL